MRHDARFAARYGTAAAATSGMQSIPMRPPALVQPRPGGVVETLGRVGYAALGVVYLLIGIVAAKAAIDGGGHVPSQRGAVREISAQPVGQVLLVLIGIGLMGYALWRMLAAVFDIEHAGSNAKGIAKRTGYAATAVMNCAAGWTALQMATGIGYTGSNGVQTWAAQIMAEPYGALLIGLAGLGLIASGAAQIRQAINRGFIRELELSRLDPGERIWIIRMGRLGLAARGVVFPIIGIALVKAALNHDPGRAKGIGEALRDLGTTSFGMSILLVVAVGLAAYGVYCVILSRYRRMPAS